VTSSTTITCFLRTYEKIAGAIGLWSFWTHSNVVMYGDTCQQKRHYTCTRVNLPKIS